jgi:hypothetical protein
MSNKQNKILEKEVLLLQNAIEEASKKKKNIIKSVIIKNIFNILENFLKSKKFVCYGGTAINNILPKKEQFYDRNIELPDYDFFSPNAIETSIELADLYYKNGYDEVEAKAGVHIGTYKVYVNFIPIADITDLNSEVFKQLQQNSIVKNGIYYAPPNYLRMAAYLELSRPDGDISRWEKVWKRLVLLNKNYPIEAYDCTIKDFIRTFDTPIDSLPTLYNTILNSIIKQKLVFFGGYAVYSYSKYISQRDRKQLIKHPDFDVLANDPLKSANIIKKDLNNKNILDVKIIKHDQIGEIIPEHYEIKIGNETIVFLYQTIACYSYNTIKVKNKNINIATIDTMLSLYLAFIYANRDYYDPKRILCIAQYLFIIQIKNRLKQKGVLKRFTTKCYGKQETMEEIRAHKAFLYNELKKNKCSKEYQKYFLRYTPANKGRCFTKNKKKNNKKSNKNKKTKKK